VGFDAEGHLTGFFDGAGGRSNGLKGAGGAYFNTAVTTFW